jgi:hypothetical protein
MVRRHRLSRTRQPCPVREPVAPFDGQGDAPASLRRSSSECNREWRTYSGANRFSADGRGPAKGRSARWRSRRRRHDLGTCPPEGPQPGALLGALGDRVGGSARPAPAGRRCARHRGPPADCHPDPRSGAGVSGPGRGAAGSRERASELALPLASQLGERTIGRRR